MKCVFQLSAEWSVYQTQLCTRAPGSIVVILLKFISKYHKAMILLICLFCRVNSELYFDVKIFTKKTSKKDEFQTFQRTFIFTRKQVFYLNVINSFPESLRPLELILIELT